jgi:hypothetical protein
MNEKLKAALIKLGFTEEQIAALTPEQVAEFESSVAVVEDMQVAFEDGFDKGDGTFDVTKVTDPTFKAAFDYLVADSSSKLDAANAERDTVKGEADQAKADAEAAKTESDRMKGELEGVKKDTAIKAAIKDTNVQDVADIFKFIDVEKLTVSADGVVEGLTEQLDALKQSKAYLFKSDEPAPNPNKGGGINPANQKDKKGYYPGKPFTEVLADHEN